MKNKDEIFKLLRESVENPREVEIVEELINKVELKMPEIEIVDETHVKCNGITYHKNTCKHYVAQLYLHRFIWSYFYGEIPNGFHIHHKDFNPKNNDIDNLQILTHAEHSTLHNQAKGKKIFRNCQRCGKKFIVGETSKRKFCSQSCSGKAQKDYQNYETKKCPICGKEFTSPKVRKRKYCSCACSSKAQKDPIKYETQNCALCSKEFVALKSHHRIYCSRACVNESRRKSNK